jgi:hypothetical protein
MKSPSDDREEKSSIADVVCSWWARHNHANVRVVLPAFALLVPLLSALRAEPTPLVTLEQRVVGASLDVTPAKLAVPKGIAGSISAQVSGGVAVPAGAVIEATLRGPSFPARRLVGKPGEPLLLPPLPLVGDYSLDAIRLADAAGVTILEGSPSRVPVNVFDDILISRVTSRPLTLDEIQERGIVIDEKNFRAVEFEVGFVLDGKTIPVKFPVVAPVFSQSTEIIPAAELEARLQQADQINRELSLGAKLPKELEGKQLNFEVQGINFQFVDPDEVDLALRIPPIPALLVVPGNVGFLHQFFSVMVFTENGAPESSSLTVRDLQAQLTLPPGPDQLPGTYDQPGDDPLRPARVGSNGQIFTKLPVVQPGPDGKLGTPDDDPRLAPHETGQAEFLVEGLQEGLHVMDLKLTALLDGLAAGPVAIEGRAAGSVLVRNPKFSLAFSHPRTVRASEPYDAFVTILNTSSVPANLVNVTLREASISGGTLAPGSPETVQLGTLLPGESATAKFRIISQRTGAITFSNLTTSDDSLVGRFRLRAGVDERGIALSPNTLLLPDFVNDLPATVRDTANRVLGQALSVATAGQLPPGILGVSRSFITAKALELAEAGQRVRYLDPLASVLPDLLLDWQGGRASSPGFDQIMRTTEAGDAFRAALFTAIEGADVPAPATAVDRLAARAADFAGRSEPWFIAASDANDFAIRAVTGDQVASFDDSTLEQALGYRGARGGWLATAAAPARFEWETASDFQRTSATIELLRVLPNGSAQRTCLADRAAGCARLLRLRSVRNGDRISGRSELRRHGRFHSSRQSHHGSRSATVAQGGVSGSHRAERPTDQALSGARVRKLRDGAGGALFETDVAGNDQRSLCISVGQRNLGRLGADPAGGTRRVAQHARTGGRVEAALDDHHRHHRLAWQCDSKRHAPGPDDSHGRGRDPRPRRAGRRHVTRRDSGDVDLSGRRRQRPCRLCSDLGTRLASFHRGGRKLRV